MQIFKVTELKEPRCPCGNEDCQYKYKWQIEDSFGTGLQMMETSSRQDAERIASLMNRTFESGFMKAYGIDCVLLLSENDLSFMTSQTKKEVKELGKFLLQIGQLGCAIGLGVLEVGLKEVHPNFRRAIEQLVALAKARRAA